MPDTVKQLPIDPFAELTMAYTADGYEELKRSIREDGQRVPILLRNGAILDGRNRYAVCQELDRAVAYEELGPISDEEALDLVVRNSVCKVNSTDPAKVEAYLICKEKGIKFKDMPNHFDRLNMNYVRKLSFIEKQDKGYLLALLKQQKVRLHNKEYDKLEDYGTINGLWRTLKGNKKFTDSVAAIDNTSSKEDDYKRDVESFLGNANAEEEYWGLYELGKVTGADINPNSALGRKVLELVKSKYVD